MIFASMPPRFNTPIGSGSGCNTAAPRTCGISLSPVFPSIGLVPMSAGLFTPACQMGRNQSAFTINLTMWGHRATPPSVMWKVMDQPHHRTIMLSQVKEISP
jgi:hypothetical protein